MKKVSKGLVCLFALTLALGFAGCSKKDVLRVATSANFPPFESFNDDNEIVGWDVDVAAYFADKMGKKLEVKHMDFDSVLTAPRSGVADIAMAGLSVNEERKQQMDFTQDIFDSSQVIIVKSDSDIKGPFDLENKKVGSQRGTVGQSLADLDKDWAWDEEAQSYILGKPSASLAYDDGSLAVKALLSGLLDAVIIDKYPAQEFVKRNSGTKIAEETVFDDSYAFGVKKGNTELLNQLNDLIDEMRQNGKMQEITDKWFGADGE